MKYVIAMWIVIALIGTTVELISDIVTSIQEQQTEALIINIFLAIGVAMMLILIIIGGPK